MSTITSGSSTGVAPGHSRLRRFAERIVLVLISVALTLVGLEIFMRVGFDILPPKIQGDIQHVRRYPWSDERIIQPIPFLTERDFQTRLEPGLHDYPVHWSDARFTFNTISVWDGHRAGLRTEPPVWPLDILTFGDSYTFCWTKFEDCWVQRLHVDHGWNVVNAGIPATGTLGQLRLMQDIAAPLKPSLVVWIWYENDVTDDYDLAKLRGEVEELPSAPYPDPVREPVGLARYSALYLLLYDALYPPPKSTNYKHYQTVMLNGRPTFVHTNEYTYPSNIVWPRAKYGWQRNVQAHEDGAKLVHDQLGAKLVIVAIPAKEEAYASLLKDNLGEKYLTEIGETRRMLLKLCADQGWNCVDMLPSLQDAVKNGQNVYYQYDAHLNPAGNLILENTLYNYIVQNNMLPQK